MRSVFWRREDHIESDRESSTDDKQFEHKVVERFFKDDAEMLSLHSLTEIVTELFGSLWEVGSS
jgi:hypothetical protein